MDNSILQRKKALLRLTLARTAFGQAIALCEHIESLTSPPNKDAASAMMTGIIVTYARPFTQSDGIGRLPSSFNEFPDHSHLKHFHETALDARNWVYAHRDNINSPALAGDVFTDEIANHLVLSIEENGHSIVIKEPQIVLSDSKKFKELSAFQNHRATLEVNKIVKSLKTDYGLGVGSYKIDGVIDSVS